MIHHQEPSVPASSRMSDLALQRLLRDIANHDPVAEELYMYGPSTRGNPGPKSAATRKRREANRNSRRARKGR